MYRWAYARSRTISFKENAIMSKKVILLLTVVALALMLFAGCNSTVDVPVVSTVDPVVEPVSLSTIGGDSGVTLRGVSGEMLFTVYSDYATIETIDEYVLVVDSVGRVQDVRFVYVGGNTFKVLAPVNGYNAGGAYRIAICDGAYLVGDGEGNNVVDFIIKKAETLDVDIKDDVVVLEAGSFTLADGKVLTARADIVAGKYIIVPVSDTAYDAYLVDSVANNGGEYVLTVSKPEQLSDVFDKIDLHQELELGDGTIVFNEEALYAAEGNMLASLASVSDYFSVDWGTPTFDLDNNLITFDFLVRVTIKGINFDIRVENDITFAPEYNYSTIPFSVYVGGDVGVDTTTTFGINTGYSVNGSENMEDVVAQLSELADIEFSESIARLFTWTYAYGPVVISYDLDLMYNLSLAGELNFVTNTYSAYTLGAYYVDGDFKSFAEKTADEPLTLEEIELYGKAGSSIGLKNTLSLSLVEIAKVGVELEFGLYLDLYGVVKIDHVVLSETVAGLYGDFGLYYDVDLVAAVGIMDFKLEKEFDLVDGRYSLATFGNRTLIIDYTDDVTNYEITSLQAVVPSLAVSEYDLVNRTVSIRELTLEDSTITADESSYFTVSDGIVTVKSDAPAEFGYDNVVQYIYYTLNANTKLEHTVRLQKQANLPFANNPIMSFDKAYPSNVIFTFEVLDSAVQSVKGIPASAYNIENNGKTLVVDSYYLVTLVNGTLELTAVTSVNEIDLWIDIYGALSITAVGKGTANDPYLIYNADQVIQLSTLAGVNNFFSNKYLKLMNDINLHGVAFSPIVSFQGNLDGCGHLIYNFVVNEQYSGYQAFIYQNLGTISNLTVQTDLVSVNRVNSIAGLVGINQGTITACTVNGSIYADYEANYPNHAYLVIGGLVARNEGTINNCTATNAINVSVEGNSVSSYVYAGGVVGYNVGTLSGLTKIGAFNVETKSWQDCYTNTISNNY